jgi:hypothetical protein
MVKGAALRRISLYPEVTVLGLLGNEYTSFAL